MLFVISLPDSDRALSRITSNGDYSVTVESVWDGHTRTATPMDALRLLTVALTDGLRVEAYPETPGTGQ